MSARREAEQNGRLPLSRTCSTGLGGLVSSRNRPHPDRLPKDATLAEKQFSVQDWWLTLNISEALVRSPGFGWNGAAGACEPSRPIGLGQRVPPRHSGGFIRRRFPVVIVLHVIKARISRSSRQALPPPSLSEPTLTMKPISTAASPGYGAAHRRHRDHPHPAAQLHRQMGSPYRFHHSRPVSCRRASPAAAP